jgi:hypothetical protein
MGRQEHFGSQPKEWSIPLTHEGVHPACQLPPLRYFPLMETANMSIDDFFSSLNMIALVSALLLTTVLAVPLSFS